MLQWLSMRFLVPLPTTIHDRKLCGLQAGLWLYQLVRVHFLNLIPWSKQAGRQKCSHLAKSQSGI